MRFLIVDTYYRKFLEEFYQKFPEVFELNYDEHKNLLFSRFFGTSNFYSKNLKKIGHEAEETIFNDPILQLKWAKEHNLKFVQKFLLQDRGNLFDLAFSKKERILSYNVFYKILKNQIEFLKPDILYIQAITYFNPVYLYCLKITKKVKYVLGQIASPLPNILYFKPYDLVLSSLPNMVEFLNKNKIKSEYLKLAFEPEILNHLREEKEKYQITFVGSFTKEHLDFIALLEDIAKNFPLRIWTENKEALKSDILKKCYMGSAWGMDMYNILFNSLITLNRHSKISENYANNMRLYEATGVGTMLITDYKENLNQIFEIGSEVEIYKNSKDLIEKISFYLNNEEKRKEIAKNGQRKTLNEHTYEKRMKELIDIIQTRL